jgi:hypothetical protein
MLSICPVYALIILIIGRRRRSVILFKRRRRSVAMLYIVSIYWAFIEY